MRRTSTASSSSSSSPSTTRCTSFSTGRTSARSQQQSPAPTEPQKPVIQKISTQRFDQRKTSSPFSSTTKKHLTSFSVAYDGGKIPCRIQHTAAHMRLQWDVPSLDSVDYTTLLVECADGLREETHPYAFVARTAFKELLLAENAVEKVVPLLPKVVPLVRMALISQKDDTFLAGLEAIELLSGVVQDALNDYLQILLSQMNRRYMDKKYKTKVGNVLNALESNTQEPSIAAAIKAKVPTYSSIR